MLFEKHETQFMEYSKKKKKRPKQTQKPLNCHYRADYGHVSERIMIIIISVRSICFPLKKQ